MKMTKVNLDLGEKLPDMPSEPAEVSRKPFYPSFTYTVKGDKGSLPDEGEMTIRFRKVRSEKSNPGEGEEPRHSCTVEVREIVSLGGSDDDDGMPRNRNKDSENALDRIRDEKIAANKSY